MAASSCSVASSFALLSTCSPSSSAAFTCASFAFREQTPERALGPSARSHHPRPHSSLAASDCCHQPGFKGGRAHHWETAPGTRRSHVRGTARRGEESGWAWAPAAPPLGGERAPFRASAGGVSQQLTTISGRVCKVDLSWSAGDRVSGRYMARDRISSDVGISWCRCSSSH